VVGEELAKTLVDTGLESSFEGGKSAAKVERIKEIEGHYVKAS
jgi:ribose 5-phosphate isomerase RpiB